MGTRHELKCWPEYFEEIWQYRKTFEMRHNDRDFQVGDLLYLREWDPKTKEYTGREIMRRNTYQLAVPNADLVIMSLGPVGLEA
jgi:hypothetical protein